MEFYKYEGTGNDFVMVDDRQQSFPVDDTALVARLCHRRFGIGADGLILLQERDGLPFMKYYNSDGNESSMCGNGGRCFTRFMYDLGAVGAETVFMAIDGLHEAKLDVATGLVSLKMIDVEQVKGIGDGTFELNTGSPHFVQFRSEQVGELPLLPEAKAIRYNQTYEAHGINVNFANLLGLKQVVMRTYERGVEDETLSCGTGATAVALSTALFNGLPAGKHQIAIEVMGGNLEVAFNFNSQEKKFTDIWLIGPANQVFKGNWVEK